MGRKNEKKSDMWKLYSMHNLDWKQGKIRVKVDSNQQYRQRLRFYLRPSKQSSFFSGTEI